MELVLLRITNNQVKAERRRFSEAEVDVASGQKYGRSRRRIFNRVSCGFVFAVVVVAAAAAAVVFFVGDIISYPA
jgi:hypothetical protein